MPDSISILSARLIGWILHRIVRFRLRVVRSQMAMALPEKSDAERADIERRFYRHLGLLLVELLQLPGSSRDEVIRRIDPEHLREIGAAQIGKQATILFSGHCGNWELVGVTVVLTGHRLFVVGKQMKTRVGEIFRQMVRDEFGMENIPVRNSIKRIFTILREGHSLAYLMDQNMVREEGVFVDFFGYPANTMSGLVVLAERSKARIMPVFCVRGEDLRSHRLEIFAPIALEYPHDDREANVRHNLRTFNRLLEEQIRRHPDQWMWIHKRWKTRPEGETTPPPFDYS